MLHFDTCLQKDFFFIFACSFTSNFLKLWLSLKVHWTLFIFKFLGFQIFILRILWFTLKNLYVFKLDLFREIFNSCEETINNFKNLNYWLSWNILVIMLSINQKQAIKSNLLSREIFPTKVTSNSSFHTFKIKMVGQFTLP